MSRYKITKMGKDIPDKEIDAYKDFESLITTYKRIRFQKRLMKSIIILLVAGGAGSLLYFFASPTTKEKIENVSTLQGSTAIITTMDSTAQRAEVDTQSIAEVHNSDNAIAESEPIVKPKSQGKEVKKVNETSSFEFVKSFPKYGKDSLFAYLQTGLEVEHPEGIKGSVVVAFTINQLGEPSTVKIMSGISDEVDKKIIELIENMPKWEPATLDGKPISSTTTLPIDIDVHPKN